MGDHTVLPRPDIAQAASGLKRPDHHGPGTTKAQVIGTVSGLSQAGDLYFDRGASLMRGDSPVLSGPNENPWKVPALLRERFRPYYEVTDVNTAGADDVTPDTEGDVVLAADPGQRMQNPRISCA